METTTNVAEMQAALLKFIDWIEIAGGLMTHPDGNTAPKADMEWLDIALAYEVACAAVGRTPMVEDHDDPLICCECNQPIEGEECMARNEGQYSHLNACPVQEPRPFTYKSFD